MLLPYVIPIIPHLMVNENSLFVLIMKRGTQKNPYNTVSFCFLFCYFKKLPLLSAGWNQIFPLNSNE